EEEPEPRGREEPAQWPRERGREWADCPHREERDAEEHKQGSEPHPEKHLLRPEMRDEEPVGERAETERGHDDRSREAEAREAALREHRAFPHGRDRRNARRADRRAKTGEKRHDDPRDERD